MEIKNFSIKIQSEESRLFQALRELNRKQVMDLTNDFFDWNPWPSVAIRA